MKWRLWLKITIGILATVAVLILANGVIDSQKARVSQARDREGNRSRDSFAPQEIYKAASPFAGLMESIRPIPASRVSMKSVGLSLMESSDKTAAVVQQPASSPLKLIRTGQVSIEVPDFEKAAKDLGRMIESLGGYIADTQVHRNPSDSRSGTISLRVPAASYESVGSKIRSLGKVMSESSNVQDVTKAYSDLETRLRVKREALNRIRELLRTKAGNLKEVLEAEKEISRITEEIEHAEGERRFFDHQISLSTIVVELSEPEPISLARPSSWWALSESLRDSAAMVAGSLALMLRLIFILFPWVGAGWCGLVCFRWVRARRSRRSESLVPGSSHAESPIETKESSKSKIMDS